MSDLEDYENPAGYGDTLGIVTVGQIADVVRKQAARIAELDRAAGGFLEDRDVAWLRIKDLEAKNARLDDENEQFRYALLDIERGFGPARDIARKALRPPSSEAKPDPAS